MVRVLRAVFVEGDRLASSATTTITNPALFKKIRIATHFESGDPPRPSTTPSEHFFPGGVATLRFQQNGELS
jgi:hypothetical protein